MTRLHAPSGDELANFLISRPLTIVVAGFVEEVGDLVVDLLVITLLGSESHSGLSCLLGRLPECRRVGRLRVVPVAAPGSDYSAKGEPQRRVTALFRSFGGVPAAESLSRDDRGAGCWGGPEGWSRGRGKRPRRARGSE